MRRKYLNIFIVIIISELTLFKSSYSFTSLINNLTVIEGTEVYIPCNLNSDKNVWYQRFTNDEFEREINGETSDRYHIKESGALQIIPVDALKDEGYYTCVSKSSTLNSTVYLNVVIRTLILSPPKDTKVVLSSTAKLRCEVKNDASITVNINWYFNDKPVNSEGSSRIQILPDGTLSIEQARNTDVGLYTCRVTSLGGNDTRSARLDVIELPYAPTNVKAQLNLNGGFVNVSWSPPFDGNSPIVKYIAQKRVVIPLNDQTGVDNVDEIAHDNTHGWSIAVANISASQNFVLITNLRPATTYQFRVSAVNSVGEGQASSSSSPPVTLPAQPPSAPPLNVVAAARSSTAITVQWQPPSSDSHNGHLLGYIIRYKLAGYPDIPWYNKNVTNAAQVSYILDDLIVWQNYEIQLGAYNAMGVGSFSSSIYVRTKEGKPASPPTLVTVKAKNSTAIKVSWRSPDPQLINGINQGFKIKAFNHKQIAKEIVEPPLPLRDKLQTIYITDLEPYTEYNITILCFTSAGDGPPNEPPIKVTTDQDLPTEVTKFTFQNILDTSVELSWFPPRKVNGLLLNYTLRYNVIGAGEEQIRVVNYSANTTTAKITELKPQTAYMFEINAWTIVGPGPVISSTMKTSIPPVLPHPPTRLAISNIGAFSVVLQFTPGFNGNTTILKYLVEAQFFKLRNSNWTVIYESQNATQKDAIVVKNLKPYTEYRLRLIPVNIVGPSILPSPISPPFQTLQAIPAHPPLNVTTRSMNPTSIRVRWTPLPPESWYGQPRGYNITYKELSNVEGVANGSLHWNISGDYHSHSFTITGLEEYTNYAVQVFAVNDVGSSKGSHLVFQRTAESTPSAGPVTVEVKSTSSTTVLVNWSEIPKNHQNGIILGFKIKYISNRNDAVVHYKIIENNELRTATLTELRKYTIYRISVCAFTHVGDGVYSPSQTVQTDQDVPGPPSNVTFPDVTLTSARILWDIPDEPNGDILGYKVAYDDDRGPYSRKSQDLESTDRTLKVNGLRSETMYQFSVTAKTKEGWGQPAIVQVFTTNSRELPGPPVNVQINESQIGSRTVTLNWKSGSDGMAPLRYYTAQVSTQGGSWLTLNNRIDFNATTYTVNGLKPFTSYQFRLRATNDIGHSEWSAETLNIQTKSAPPDRAPTGVSIYPYSPTAIAVKWMPVQEWYGDEFGAGYKVQFCLISLTLSCNSVIVRGKSESNVSIEELERDQQYEIKIIPFNSRGDGPSSKSRIVYVGEAVPSGEPLNVIAFPMSSQEVNVTWLPPENNKQNGQILGYKIFYWLLSPSSTQTSNDNFKELFEVVPNTRHSFVLLDLEKFSSYFVQVLAFNPAGDGPRSQPITVQTKEDIPGEIGPLVFSSITMSSLKISWDVPLKPNGILTGYYVIYETLIGDFSKQVKQKITDNHLTVTGLKEIVTYTFKVRAVTSVGAGPERVGNVTTGPQIGSPPPPYAFTVTQSLTSVILKWRNPAYRDIKGYLIESKQLLNSGEGDWQPKALLDNGLQEHFDLSFTHLTPSARYTFRIMSMNDKGISEPISSDLSSVITTPSHLELRAKQPFYFEMWFVTSVGAAIIVFIILLISCICVYNTIYKYKQEMKNGRSLDAFSEAEFGLDDNLNPYSSGLELRHTTMTSSYRRSNGTLNSGLTMAATKSPPRPSPGSITYSDDDVDDDDLDTKDPNIYGGSSGDSVTEKPSELSSSGPDTESDDDLATASHFVNHYANVNDTLRKGQASWKKHAHPYVVKPPTLNRNGAHSSHQPRPPMRSIPQQSHSQQNQQQFQHEQHSHSQQSLQPSQSTQYAPPSYNLAMAVTSDDSELDCPSVNLNGGRVIVNNAVGSRAGVIPGFSSFV